MEMNDYLSSFKVAHYEKREIQDGDDEDVEDEDSNVEVCFLIIARDISVFVRRYGVCFCTWLLLILCVLSSHLCR